MDCKRLADVRLGTAGARAILSLAASLALSSALAATKVEDGFTTAVGSDGTPLNSVTSVRQGTDVYYWVHWKDHPPGHGKLECIVMDGPAGEALVDETETTEDSDAEDTTFCGLGTDNDTEPGTYYFVQYLDGEKVGEGSIEVQSRYTKNIGLRRQLRYAVGALALVIVTVGWVAKKRGKRGKAADPVVIGSRAGGVSAQPTPAPPPADDDGAQELRKLGLLYPSLLGQADKAKALETGRRYLGLLLKARREAEALKVFKECAAIDASFRPERGEDVLPLARAARAAGDPQSAVACLRGFDKVFPGHALIPEVYVFSAKLMAEDLGNPDMARKILEHVVQKYPGHYVAQEAKKYLQSMPQPT